MNVPARRSEYPHISIVPGVAGDQPVVEGSRIPVAALARAHQLGMEFDEILAQYPALRPEALHAALAYYLDHRADMDRLIEEAAEPLPGATIITV
ncbi:MAG TPA: DUF433 domain-containing protein [Polyangia bacterium]